MCQQFAVCVFLLQFAINGDWSTQIYKLYKSDPFASTFSFIEAGVVSAMGARWHLAAACCAILALCTLVPVASAVGAVSEPSNALRSLRNGPSVLGRRVLVLSDDVNIGTANAAFFASLTGPFFSFLSVKLNTDTLIAQIARGFNLSIKTTSSSSTSLSLGAHGEPAFDHVMIFAVSSSFAFPTSGDLSISSLLSFAENGGNLLVATGPSVSLPIRELANQLGFDLAPSGSSFIDHFAYEVTRDTGAHSLVAVNDVTTIFTSNKLSHPVVMTAAGLITGSTDLAFDLLRGNPTSLIHIDAATAAKADATPFAVGRMCTVVGALQTRTNSRVIVSSSVDLFSDKWTKATGLQFANGEKADKTGNLQFAEAAAMWLMQQSHALRVVATSHHRVGESERPPHYRIMDNVVRVT